jgi:PIN domain nuclease of toxin-antitoxin system
MVIDSHVLYWWLERHPKLGEQAARAFAQAERGESRLLIAAVSFWEFANKERMGQFVATRPVREWPGILRKADWIEIVPADTEVWLRAAELEWAHRDPADRMIAAIALMHGVPVLTKDRVFHESGCPVEAVW